MECEPVPNALISDGRAVRGSQSDRASSTKTLAGFTRPDPQLIRICCAISC